jgi:hypothetical protein
MDVGAQNPYSFTCAFHYIIAKVLIVEEQKTRNGLWPILRFNTEHLHIQYSGVSTRIMNEVCFSPMRVVNRPCAYHTIKLPS